MAQKKDMAEKSNGEIRLDVGEVLRKKMPRHYKYVPRFVVNALVMSYVTLWNLNYEHFTEEGIKEEEQFLEEFTKEDKEFTKGNEEFLKEGKQFLKKRKEFLKAQRGIYKIILLNPHSTIAQMSEKLNLSDRQIRKYIRRLTTMNLIAREGGRKIGIWRIIDKDYESIFDKYNKEEKV